MDASSREDAEVLMVLLDDVEREPAVAVADDAIALQRSAAVLPGKVDSRDGAAASESGPPWQVTGTTVAAALALAREKHGDVRVSSAFRRRTWWGRKQVVLEVEPQASVPVEAAYVGPRQWSRAALRELGVPTSFLRRLPVNDPETPQEWESALRKLLLAYILIGPRDAQAHVNGSGARGAALMLVGVEQGMAMGQLDGANAPVTSQRLLDALAEAMPPWQPHLPSPATSGLAVERLDTYSQSDGFLEDWFANPEPSEEATRGATLPALEGPGEGDEARQSPASHLSAARSDSAPLPAKSRRSPAKARRSAPDAASVADSGTAPLGNSGEVLESSPRVSSAGARGGAGSAKRVRKARGAARAGSSADKGGGEGSTGSGEQGNS